MFVQLSTFDSMSVREQDALTEALRPLFSRIADLQSFIELATTLCHHPSENDLTRDESAAIYLYTMEWDGRRLDERLAKDLRNRRGAKFQRWIGFLKLLDSALIKLPSVRTTVWFDGETLAWWFPLRCTSDPQRTSPTTHRIEALNAKRITQYSSHQDEEQFFIRMATRMQPIPDERSNRSSYQEVADKHEEQLRKIQQCSDGRVYRGDSLNDLTTGYGHSIWPDGDYYQGEFKLDNAARHESGQSAITGRFLVPTNRSNANVAVQFVNIHWETGDMI